jgi:transposase-like protein
MKASPYRGFRFPPAIIQHAIWLYLRFTLSLRDVEELLAERGIVVTYETVRVWVARFGPLIARRLRRRRGPSSRIWHLDEMFVRIAGRQKYLWRAVDSEGEVLDVLVQSRRDKAAAVRLMRKLLKNQGVAPTELVTDRLRAYVGATRELGLSAEHIQGKRKNNRAEGSHVPIRLRERKMQGFRSPGSAQRFLAAHAAVANTFSTCRHLISAATHRQFRAEAFAAWREAAELAA